MNEQRRKKLTSFRLWSLISGIVGFIGSIISIAQAFGKQGITNPVPFINIIDAHFYFGTVEIKFADLIFAILIYTLIFLPIGAYTISNSVGKATIGIVNPILILLWGMAFCRGNWFLIGVTVTIFSIWIVIGSIITSGSLNKSLSSGCLLFLMLIPTNALVLMGFGNWYPFFAWIYTIVLFGLIAAIAWHFAIFGI